MDPERTTTTGDSLFVTNINPFQIIKAEKTIMAKFNNWNVNCLLFAQSFLSSRTCLSIISLNMVYVDYLATAMGAIKSSRVSALMVKSRDGMGYPLRLR
mmetsp:Transcript_20037/g.42149  ORF Transcript_20037/g.42149 Transcript_20037/m.42149 type:complete len:99 (+) Transcript_20037:609-905(+)